MIELHDKIGIMPIVAPIIEEKQKEISRLNECISQMAFLDKNTQTVKKGQQKLAFFDIIKSGVRTC